MFVCFVALPFSRPWLPWVRAGFGGRRIDAQRSLEETDEQQQLLRCNYSETLLMSRESMVHFEEQMQTW